jgi:hypothetical protein
MDTQDLDDSIGIMLKELKLYGLDIHGKGSDEFELARKIYMTAKRRLNMRLDAVLAHDGFNRGD